MKQRACRFIVKGRVQGVGFRNYTLKKAKIIGIRGWVKNLEDGRVEAFAIGCREKLEEFANVLNRGPMLAEVDELDTIEINPLPNLSDDEFRIIF